MQKWTLYLGDCTEKLHLAVREGHAEVVQLPLQAGADPGHTYNSWDKLLAIHLRVNVEARARPA